MIIYFIGKNSNLKSPKELSKRGGIVLSYGDILIRASSRGYEAYLIENPEKEWGKNRLVALSVDSKNLNWNNFLVYSFDGVDKRRGNVEALKILVSIFRDTVLESVFRAAEDILSFKADRWDTACLIKLYVSNAQAPTTIPCPKEEPNNLETSPSEISFISYLPISLQEIARKRLKGGESPKEVISFLRKTESQKFRSAFECFATEHPLKSIYKNFQ